MGMWELVKWQISVRKDQCQEIAAEIGRKDRRETKWNLRKSIATSTIHNMVIPWMDMVV